MKLEQKTETTAESTKAKRLAKASIILVVTGLLLSSVSIKALYVIYICWGIWFGAYFCGTAALKTLKDGRSRLLANTGCALSVIFALGLTFMIYEIYLIDAAHCRSKLLVLGKSIKAYCEKHNGEFPDSAKWGDLIIGDNALNISKETFSCTRLPEGVSGYALNKNLSGKHIAEVDPNVVLLFETNAGWNQSGSQELMCPNRHELLFRRSGSYIVCIGKENPFVRFVHSSEVEKLRWNP